MNTDLLAGTDRIDLMLTFVRIVETGSLSAAARDLGTSQPTVSRRLQSLERMLGVKLLQRTTHTMKLTEDGERCFARAKALIQDWDAMAMDLRAGHEEPRGTLRVLVPHAFGQDQMVGLVADYLRRHAHIRVEWLLQDRRPDFVAEGIDCAVQVGTVDDPAVVSVRLAEIPRIVVAAPGVWGDGPPPIDAHALAALPWLALQTFYRDQVVLTHASDRRLHRFAIQPRLSTDSLYALRNATLMGLGVSIVSAWSVVDELASGRLVQLAPDWQAAPLPVYLSYPPARHAPAKLRYFIDLMRSRMPEISGLRPDAPRHTD